MIIVMEALRERVLLEERHNRVGFSNRIVYYILRFFTDEMAAGVRVCSFLNDLLFW